MNNAQSLRGSILGAAGAMGTLLARNMRRSGYVVTGFDIIKPAAPDNFDSFIVGDVLHPNSQSNNAWAASHTVIVCLPNRPALVVIDSLSRVISDRALIVDTLSVKTPVIDSLKSIPLKCEYLSINPMFAPSLGFDGQKVVAVNYRNGDIASSFIQMMKGWGASVEHRTAEEHDRASAVMQVATHIILLCLGRTVCDFGLNLHDLIKIAPPPHLMCLAMLSRILTAAPETYWDIQRHNPYGEEVRNQIISALTELSAIIKSGDSSGFVKTLESMKQTFEPELKMLTKVAADAIRGASETAR